MKKILVLLSSLSLAILSSLFPNSINVTHSHECHPFEEKPINERAIPTSGLLNPGLSNPLPSLSGFSRETYFRNLTKYGANNTAGSCSFVAVANILAYYDTFYNDLIIDGNYERKDAFQTAEDALLVSPGIAKTESFTTTIDYDYLIDLETTSEEEKQRLKKEKSNELCSFIESRKETDFQCKLISNANAMQGRTADTYSSSTGCGSWQEILDYSYGQDSITFNFVDYWDLGTRDDLYDLAYQKLSEENTVLYLEIERTTIDKDTGEEKTSYHAVVAYAFDDEGLHTHFGWGQSYNDTILQTSGWDLKTIAWLEFPGFAFQHSKNYAIEDIGYCGCGKHVIHEYYKYDSGMIYPPTSKNSFRQNSLPGPGITFDGPFGPGTMPIDPVISLDNHVAYCRCGHSTSEKHYVYEGSSYSEGNLLRCAACGAMREKMRVIPFPEAY